MLQLTPQKARILRITHVDNVPWILDHGLHCQASAVSDAEFRPVGNADIIGKRARRAVPIEPGGTLSNYIPFYFTPWSPMLFNIKTGYGGLQQTPMADIVILVASLPKLADKGVRFVFTDRHAYLQTARFFSHLQDLAAVDWAILQRRDFKRDNDDPGKVERYQAEALVHRYLPVEMLTGIACFDAERESMLRAEVGRRGLGVPVKAYPRWYF